MSLGTNRSVQVLVMDGSGSVGLDAALADQGWQRLSCRAPYEALRMLRKNQTPDLVLLAPGIDWTGALELCRSIKFDVRTAFVPVVFILPGDLTARSVEVFQAGADDCMAQGVSDTELVIRLRKAIAVKRANETLEDANAIITSLASAVEGKDQYTCGHVERVGMYAVAIGRRCGLSAEDLAALKTGGVVHDIGKIGIPDQILNKPGKLTDEEMAIMKRHPVIGYDILRPLRTFQNVAPIVRWHHEKPNGRGYPDGLAGEQIPVLARITAVADVFDALHTDRPYRKGFELSRCRAILRESAETGDLDERFVQILLEVLDEGLADHLHAPAA